MNFVLKHSDGRGLNKVNYILFSVGNEEINMCGIAGYYSTSGKFADEELRKMTGLLNHRGPDADGFFSEGPAGLGHRRLSIIDLTTNANQPMISADGRYVICYNGETYNFKEISPEILNEHFSGQFRSNGDTEVVLEGFAKYGVSILDKMIGMFAFAIFDRQSEDLYLVRDRMGIKPLYYYWDGVDLAFASELKSIQSLNSLQLEIRHESIRDFLHYGFIPAPYSIYKSVFKLNSGSFLKVTREGIKSNRYWEIVRKISGEVLSDETEAISGFEKLLRSSVEYRMYSDVPLGVFLSGGIDSSTVAAAAAEVSSKKINTYSIGFNESAHDESVYARAIAKHLGTDHHEFTVTSKEAMELLPRMAEIFDEPFADSSAIPTMMVSKLAGAQVKVTLSGDGGDELFYGYGAHLWAKRLHSPAYKLLHKSGSFLMRQMSDRYKRIASLLDYDSETNLPSHIFSQEQYFFSRKEIETLCRFSSDENKTQNPASWGTYDNASGLWLEKFTKRLLQPEEKQALYDLQLYLQDDLLAKVDRSSMLYSLETRVPLIDHRIIEFTLNLDPALKIRKGESKYLLKKYLYQKLPAKLFDRPKKGFSIPLSDWLSKELSYFIEEYLSEKLIGEAGFVDYKMVENLILRFRNGDKHLYNRLWLLIVLHQWHLKN